MDFYVDPVREPAVPEVGDLIKLVVNGQLRHAIVMTVQPQDDDSYEIVLRPDPTEPPLSD